MASFNRKRNLEEDEPSETEKILALACKLYKFESSSADISPARHIFFYSYFLQTPIILNSKMTIGVTPKIWSLAIFQKTLFETTMILCEGLFTQQDINARTNACGNPEKIQSLPIEVRKSIERAATWIHFQIKGTEKNPWIFDLFKSKENCFLQLQCVENKTSIDQAFLSFNHVREQGSLFIIDTLADIKSEFGDTDDYKSVHDVYIRRLGLDFTQKICLEGLKEYSLQDKVDEFLKIAYQIFVGLIAVKQTAQFHGSLINNKKVPRTFAEVVAQLTLFFFKGYSQRPEHNFDDVFFEAIQLGFKERHLTQDRRPAKPDPEMFNKLTLDSGPSTNKTATKPLFLSIWDSLPNDAARKKALAGLTRSLFRSLFLRYNKGEAAWDLMETNKLCCFKGFHQDPQAAPLLLDIIRYAKFYLTQNSYTTPTLPSECGRIYSNIKVQVTEDEVVAVFEKFATDFGEDRIDIRPSINNQEVIGIHSTHATSSVLPEPSNNQQSINSILSPAENDVSSQNYPTRHTQTTTAQVQASAVSLQGFNYNEDPEVFIQNLAAPNQLDNNAINSFQNQWDPSQQALPEDQTLTFHSNDNQQLTAENNVNDHSLQPLNGNIQEFANQNQHFTSQVPTGANRSQQFEDTRQYSHNSLPPFSIQTNSANNPSSSHTVNDIPRGSSNVPAESLQETTYHGKTIEAFTAYGGDNCLLNLRHLTNPTVDFTPCGIMETTASGVNWLNTRVPGKLRGNKTKHLPLESHLHHCVLYDAMSVYLSKIPKPKPKPQPQGPELQQSSETPKFLPEIEATKVLLQYMFTDDEILLASKNGRVSKTTKEATVGFLDKNGCLFARSQALFDIVRFLRALAKDPQRQGSLDYVAGTPTDKITLVDEMSETDFRSLMDGLVQKVFINKCNTVRRKILKERTAANNNTSG